MTTSWHGYPKVFAFGHRALAELFFEEVIVEEKVDGSQFSFGRFGGELMVRSRGQVLNIDAPEKMFEVAVNAVSGLDLRDGWTYRGEYLQKPCHNTLAYDRVPINNIILFDINIGEEEYLDYDAKYAEAQRIGLEVVPLLYRGRVDSAEFLLSFLERTSILGGQKVEGVVAKNYRRFGLDKKALMGKFVSELFKEVHAGEWKKNNPSGKDFIGNIVLKFKTEARWHKAVQHLREAGSLTDSPKDIGALMKNVHRDIDEECGGEIKELLWKHAAPHIKMGVASGLAEWYKRELLKSQFVE